MRLKIFNALMIICFLPLFGVLHAADQVGLYRTFERSIENTNPYTNKFNDVNLTALYISPSGDSTEFMGFFDGDGLGGGDKETGNVWKIRFLPNEVGEWKYEWTWSDTTTGGNDTFICDSTDAGKGILQAYNENPRWLAYNGTDPVWLKSYYESGHGSIAQPLDWLAENVYQPLIDRGYNHFQVNWLLSLCCFSQYYTDGPAQSTDDLSLYESGKASSTMRLDVWKMMEQNVSWLNDRNIGLFMFLGFDGGRNGGSAWTALSESEKDFYVRYVLARLAPYANIAGWNYVWEVPGDREEEELGWARIVQTYDVFDHLRGYQDEKPKYNEFHRPEYNFAGVENHRIHSDDREPEFWAAPWTHHKACLLGYYPGKPVYMVEGNALWRRYWSAKIKKETGKAPTPDEFRQSAWACATAGASFNWCGHQGSGDLMAYGPQGYPFHGDINTYASSALEIDILSDVMNNELDFYKMIPADTLLSRHDTTGVWCLAEEGNQYLVFAANGASFELELAAGQYNSNLWMNTKTGAGVPVDSIDQASNENKAFTPPSTSTDWILLIRSEWDLTIREESKILSAETDTSGLIVRVECSEVLDIPAEYSYGFTINKAGSTSSYPITKIEVAENDSTFVLIELSEAIYKDVSIVLNYAGTLMSTDSAYLDGEKDFPVVNKSTAEEEVENSIVVHEMLKCTIYPNPFTEQIEISSDEIIDVIQIFDAAGKLVYEKRDVGLTQTRLNLFDLQQGMYLVHIKSGSNSGVEKLMKI